MITCMNYSNIIGKQVYTTKGKLCGIVEDVVFDPLNVKALLVNTKPMSEKQEDKTSIVFPYKMVKAISDIILIFHTFEEAEKDKVSFTPVTYCIQDI